MAQLSPKAERPRSTPQVRERAFAEGQAAGTEAGAAAAAAAAAEEAAAIRAMAEGELRELQESTRRAKGEWEAAAALERAEKGVLESELRDLQQSVRGACVLLRVLASAARSNPG
jgi:hypothetical protein